MYPCSPVVQLYVKWVNPLARMIPCSNAELIDRCTKIP
jgi:hypothetical protein